MFNVIRVGRIKGRIKIISNISGRMQISATIRILKRFILWKAQKIGRECRSCQIKVAAKEKFYWPTTHWVLKIKESSINNDRLDLHHQLTVIKILHWIIIVTSNRVKKHPKIRANSSVALILKEISLIGAKEKDKISLMLRKYTIR